MKFRLTQTSGGWPDVPGLDIRPERLEYERIFTGLENVGFLLGVPPEEKLAKWVGATYREQDNRMDYDVLPDGRLRIRRYKTDAIVDVPDLAALIKLVDNLREVVIYPEYDSAEGRDWTHVLEHYNFWRE